MFKTKFNRIINLILDLSWMLQPVFWMWWISNTENHPDISFWIIFLVAVIYMIFLIVLTSFFKCPECNWKTDHGKYKTSYKLFNDTVPYYRIPLTQKCPNCEYYYY